MSYNSDKYELISGPAEKLQGQREASVSLEGINLLLFNMQEFVYYSLLGVAIYMLLY